MKLRDHYDWIVLGSHPGALLSANLTARLGLSVLNLHFSNALTAKISKSGQVFDPEPNYLLGFDHKLEGNALVSQCLNPAGEILATDRLFRVGQMWPQVLTPNFRLVLEGQDQIQNELSRELGKGPATQLGLAQALKRFEPELNLFWNRLPQRLNELSLDLKKRNLGQAQTIQEVVRKISQHHKAKETSSVSWISEQTRISEVEKKLNIKNLNEICSGLYFEITSTFCKDPTLFDLLHVFSLSRTGASFKGGMTAYRDFLIRQGLELGVHHPENGVCKRVFIEQNKFVGVQISGAGNMISGGAAILGCSLSRIIPRTSSKSASSFFNWGKRKVEIPTPQGWRFTLAFTVHREVIPEKMQTRAVWKEEGAPVLELEIADSDDYGVSDSSLRTLFLRTVLPFSAETLELEYQRLAAGRMLRQATEIIPFLEFHVVRVYPDFMAGQSSGSGWGGARIEKSLLSNELAEVYGFPSLDAIPDNLLIFSSKGLGSTTGIEKLFSASEESYPALGSLGGTVAALESVAWIATQSGRTQPFLNTQATDKSNDKLNDKSKDK